jgi:hypothetical protein
MSEATVVETQSQLTKVGVIQSLDVGITTTIVEMIVASNMDVVKKGTLIGSTTKLVSGSGGVLTKNNLNQNSALPTTITRVVGTPQMVFNNPIMTIHVNMIVDRPLMSSMVVGGYKSTNVVNPKGGYQKPFVVTPQNFNHREDHLC